VYSEYTYIKIIKPGKVVNPGRVNMTEYNGNVKSIGVAITKIHTTDGKTYDIPEYEWDFLYWILD